MKQILEKEKKKKRRREWFNRKSNQWNTEQKAKGLVFMTLLLSQFFLHSAQCYCSLLQALFSPPKLEKQRRELSMILADDFRIWKSVENTIHKRTSRIRQLRSENGLAVQERNSANKYQCDLSVIPSYTVSFLLKKNHFEPQNKYDTHPNILSFTKGQHSEKNKIQS